MGVSHKTVRQLVTQKKKTIRDRQFFTSQLFAGHLADMAAAQTRRYGYNRRVKVLVVWETKNPERASTENEFIWINAGHPTITKHRAREDRYNLVCGLFSHELGHILYTDFLAGQTFVTRLEASQWYPEKPLLRNITEQRHEADIWADLATDPKRMQAFCKVAFRLLNIIEDGYVESKMLNRYPGVLGTCLAFMREVSFDDSPTLTQRIENEDSGESHIWLTLAGLILSYVKWGELKYGDEPLSDERIQTVFSLIGDLDNALANPNAKERICVVCTILVRCWPHVKDYLDFCAEREASGGAGSSSAVDIAEWLMGGLAGASKSASGSTMPVGEKAGSASPASAGSKRAATAAMAKKTDEDESDEEDTSDAPESGDAASESGEEDDETPGDAEAGTPDFSGPPGQDNDSSSEAQDVTAEEGGRIPLHHTDRVSAPSGGTVEQDGDYAGTGYAGAATDIERILGQIAEDAVYTTLEDQRTREINELAQSISYGDAHDGVNFVVHRISSVPQELKDAYNLVAPPLLQISKAMQRSVTQQLKDRRSGGKQTGLLMGRRLDIHALPRNDGHIFYKNRLPVQVPQMALAFLGDESGSMGSKDRVTYVRASAIILEDFCRCLGIPIIIYGHTEDYNVDLYSYAEFDAIDPNDRYRLMDISSRCCNRDGAALRFVAERLCQRPEEVKILFYVSDGQPAASGYSGTAAEADLQGILREYQRKGITFVTASIGDDRENLRRIYGNSCMDITDLTRLPIQLTQVVKQHIRT